MEFNDVTECFLLQYPPTCLGKDILNLNHSLYLYMFGSPAGCLPALNQPQLRTAAEAIVN